MTSTRALTRDDLMSVYQVIYKASQDSHHPLKSTIQLTIYNYKNYLLQRSNSNNFILAGQIQLLIKHHLFNEKIDDPTLNLIHETIRKNKFIINKEEGFDIIDTADGMAQQAEDKRLDASHLLTLGEAHIKEGDLNKAKLLFERALSKHKEIPSCLSIPSDKANLKIHEQNIESIKSRIEGKNHIAAIHKLTHYAHLHSRKNSDAGLPKSEPVKLSFQWLKTCVTEKMLPCYDTLKSRKSRPDILKLIQDFNTAELCTYGPKDEKTHLDIFKKFVTLIENAYKKKEDELCRPTISWFGHWKTSNEFIQILNTEQKQHHFKRMLAALLKEIYSHYPLFKPKFPVNELKTDIDYTFPESPYSFTKPHLEKPALQKPTSPTLLLKK